MANTSTSSTTLPDWVTKPTQGAITDISSWLKSPDNYVYGSKPGESLHTPLSQSQNEAIGNVNWLSDQNLARLLGIDKSTNLWDAYTGAGPQTISGGFKNTTGAGLDTERLVDEDGFLGKISDYMNPYLQQVLDPQIRELDEGRQRAIRDQGASQTMAGAFGDARHGIMDSEIFGKTQEAIGDVTGRTMSQGFDTAMGLRSGDIGRKDQMELAKAGFAEGDVNRALNVATLNQGARERNLDRIGTGAKAATDNGQTYLKSFMDVNDALFNAGEVERDVSEERRTAQERFQTLIKDKKYNDALKLLGSLQGTAQPSTTTSEQSSNDGLMGILGSLLGGLL